MAHPPAPLGFAWLWFIEQKKKGKRKEALSKKRSSDSAQAGFEGRCACRQNILIQRDPRRRLGVQPRRTRQESSLAIGQLQNGCFGFSTPGLLMKRGSAKIRLG
jgi:hypothetical protein